MSAVDAAEKLTDNASVEEIKAAQKNIEAAMEALKKFHHGIQQILAYQGIS